MERILNSRNVLIAANAFNPSVIRESFLMKQGVLHSEGNLEPGFVFSDQIVNVPTKKFTLIVVPQQLQLVLVERADAHELVKSIVPSIIKALPHTPYTAIGLNFVWLIVPEEPLDVATRRLFSASGSVFGDAFDTPDSCFGFFASKDIGAVRLRADVKPVRVEVEANADKSKHEMIQCAFNFHVDLTTETAVEKITALCDRWQEFDSLSEELFKRIERGVK
jgi:hypothetical protein